MGFDPAWAQQVVVYMVSEGFSDGTPVQRACWKEMLSGRNCRVESQPGTGKTLAFLLPIATKLVASSAEGGIRALIFVPTRELGEQIFNVCHKLQRLFKLKTVSACGGAPISDQIEEIQKGADILVGTPGRLIELLFDKYIDLDRLEILVLDEADKMMTGDLGRQLEGLKEHLLSPLNTPQVDIALSMSCIRAGWEAWTGDDAVALSFSTDAHLVSPSITQVVHVCAEHKKLAKLKKHLGKIKADHQQERSNPRILIFANTIKKVRAIYTELEKAKWRLAMLHGKRSQPERQEAMDSFRCGRVQILVATDVAGRGIDIQNLPYVVNYDFPSNLETYIHRIGRTGRLAAHGHAYSFFTRNLAPMAANLITLLEYHGQSIDPNLPKLQESYQEATQFMQQMDAIKQEDTSEMEAGAKVPLQDALSAALCGQKRRRSESEGAMRPIYARK